MPIHFCSAIELLALLVHLTILPLAINSVPQPLQRRLSLINFSAVTGAEPLNCNNFLSSPRYNLPLSQQGHLSPFFKSVFVR